MRGGERKFRIFLKPNDGDPTSFDDEKGAKNLLQIVRDDKVASKENLY